MMELQLPSDEVLAIYVPIAVYWLYSGLCMMLGSLEKYRLHSRKEEDEKNLVSKTAVIKLVLLQHLVQAIIAYVVIVKIGNDSSSTETSGGTLIVLVIKQFFVGMLVIDTWQYFWHRYLHLNPFLYRHVHSWHHRLVVPYAYGSQYNHPFEGLLDTLGGALAFLISGMSPRTSIFFFSFSIIKAIDDHCGIWLPGNILHLFFWNNTAYHDVHHQLYGNKYNFSQPFFITWDKIFGTHMPYTVERRAEGGFITRPLKFDGGHKET